MLGKRRLQHESLESRRLLAANCQPVDAPLGESDALQVLESVSIAEAEAIQTGEIAGDVAMPIGIYHLSYGPDLVHEQGNKLFVVDQQPYEFEGGRLFIFERGDDGSLENLAEVEVGFPVERMIVAGDQVLLFGNNYNWFLPALLDDDSPRTVDPAGNIVAPPEFPQTVVVTVNLGSEVEVIRQEFEGLYYDIHHEGDRIVIVSSAGNDAVIAIYPPSVLAEYPPPELAIYPPPAMEGFVTTYDITGDGLLRVASQEIELFGMTEVNERDFYAATTSHPDIVFLTPDGAVGDANDSGGSGIRAPDEPIQPIVTVSRYLLGDDAIEEFDSLEIGSGYLSSFDVSPDGRTAVAVRSEFNGAGPTTNVDLLSLSGGQVSLFESIRLAEFSGQVVVSGPDYVVLRNYRNNTLVVIDANQDIDIAAENRVRKIEIPDRLHVSYEYLQVTDDRLVLRAERITDGTEADANGETHDRRESLLLTISISEARIIADTRLPERVAPLPSQQLFLIDSESERFGLLVRGATSTSDRPQFLFGRLSKETGEFDSDGTIPVSRWLEIDANADRLISRESDRILEYDWENPEDPIVTPLGEPDPTIEAVNDEYTLHANGEDHMLNVLANDEIHQSDLGDTEIVELIGAPEGAEIVRGNLVRIPAAALRDAESLRFEYVISDGRHRSSAVVEIEIESISEDQVRELVEAVRRQAAEDLNVSVRVIEITSVERVFTEPLPIVLRDDANEFDLSPGILVTLTAPNATALYAASLDGQIIQVFVSRRELLVELGLRAVDENGETLEQVADGDEFWLEFNADDLRTGGLGVYAAFFDLVVPTEHLVITGPIEYGDGFTSIAGGEFDEGEIDELGAIGGINDAPGGERQQILRIGVQAVGAGEITLQPEPADGQGTATLLRGRDTEVPSSRVRYSPLTLSITEPPDGEPLDADGNGTMTVRDALVVINFLGRYGATSLEELTAKVLNTGIEGEAPTTVDIAAMRRYDTSGDGVITALDALVVINGLGSQMLADEMAEGMQVGMAFGTLVEDDDDDDDDDVLRVTNTLGI